MYMNEHIMDSSYNSPQITQHPSIHIHGDIYDEFGRNYSAYLRLLHNIQWTTVYYNKNKNKHKNKHKHKHKHIY